jgi:hypothetical protein
MLNPLERNALCDDEARVDQRHATGLGPWHGVAELLCPKAIY